MVLGLTLSRPRFHGTAHKAHTLIECLDLLQSALGEPWRHSREHPSASVRTTSSLWGSDRLQVPQHHCRGITRTGMRPGSLAETAYPKARRQMTESRRATSGPKSNRGKYPRFYIGNNMNLGLRAKQWRLALQKRLGKLGDGAPLLSRHVKIGAEVEQGLGPHLAVSTFCLNQAEGVIVLAFDTAGLGAPDIHTSTIPTAPGKSSIYIIIMALQTGFQSNPPVFTGLP